MTHIRIRLRGMPGHFFCGRKEFEPGAPRLVGGYRPAKKNGCPACLEKFNVQKARISANLHKMPVGITF